MLKDYRVFPKQSLRSTVFFGGIMYANDEESQKEYNDFYALSYAPAPHIAMGM